MNEGVSIIVCCYNSATRLPETLRHIAAQKTPAGLPWEVIVVNNASQDNTREAAEFTWKHLGTTVPFSVVDEPVPGLSAARDRGLLASRYEYLLFCDDDNWLDENYVRLAFEIMQSGRQIGALGGRFEAVCETPPPGWFDYFAPNYTVGRPAPISGDITFSKSYVSGAGAVYRRSVLLFLKENGFSSLLTDRKGNSLSTGGDVEIGYAIRMAGFKIWYDDRLKLRHFIPKERLTRNYVERLYKGYLESLPVHLAYQQNFARRPAYKQSWPWLMAVRVFLVIRRALKPASESINKESWIPGFELRYEINMMRSLLKKRRTYTINLNKVKNSAWNRSMFSAASKPGTQG